MNDKYYTKIDIASKCIGFAKYHIPNFNNYVILKK